MENKILKNMFKNMDYDTYKKIDKVSFYSTLYGVVNPIVVWILTCPPLEIALLSYVFLSQIYYFSTTIFNCEKYTKDISELKELYNIVISEFVKLINQFELKNPVEIYAFYNQVLNNGYLSYNKFFHKGNSDINDLNNWYGVNIITGSGVCRHIASMLDDVYKKMNITSCTSSVYLDKNQVMFEQLENLISTYELQLKSITDNEKKELIKQLLFKAKKIKKEYKLKFEPMKKIYGNHMINFVKDNDFCYILDPSNEIIYKKYDTNNNTNILKQPIISPLTGKVKLTRTNNNHNLKREILLLPDSSIDDDNVIINNTTNLYNNNLDLIDFFAHENNELYGEITNRLVKIKKK